VKWLSVSTSSPTRFVVTQQGMARTGVTPKDRPEAEMNHALHCTLIASPIKLHMRSFPYAMAWFLMQ
jgi:hypothetical protein